MCKLYLIQLRWVWRRDEVFHHRLKSHNSPRIIMLVAVSGYLGTVGSVKISMSQSIIYPTDLARHYNTFLPFSPLSTNIIIIIIQFLRTAGNHTFSSQSRTALHRNYWNCMQIGCLCWRYIFIWFYEKNIIFCFIKFEKLLSWAWWYLFEYTENTRQGADREKCEASWYHHLIFTLSGGDSTGSIIPIETGIFNMKIPQVLFKIIQP